MLNFNSRYSAIVRPRGPLYLRRLQWALHSNRMVGGKGLFGIRTIMVAVNNISIGRWVSL